MPRTKAVTKFVSDAGGLECHHYLEYGLIQLYCNYREERRAAGISDDDKVTNLWGTPRPRTWCYSHTTGNGALRRHLVNYHRDEYRKLAIERGWSESIRNLIDPPVPSQMESLNPTLSWSQENFVKIVLRFIVSDDQVSLLSYGQASIHVLITVTFPSLSGS